jgi:hypothetical protein
LKKTTSFILLSFFFIGSITALWIQWPALTNESLVQNDARIHIWWLRSEVDDSIFPDDDLVQLMRSKEWRNFGFNWFLKFLAHFQDPVMLVKYIGLILFPVTLVSLVWAGSLLGGTFAGVGAGLLYLAFALHSSLSGIIVFDGLQRSFKDLLIIWSIVGLTRRSYWMLVMTALVGMLFYPLTLPIITVCAITMFFVTRYNTISLRLKRCGLLVLLIVFLIGLVSVSIMYFDRPFYGFKGSLHENPRFGPDGREPIFQEGSSLPGIAMCFLVSHCGGLLGQNLAQIMSILCLLTVGFIVMIVFRLWKPPSSVAIMLCSSIFCFFSAWLLAWLTGNFLAYFPSRYETILITVILWISHLASRVQYSKRNNSQAVIVLLLSLVPWMILDFHLYPTFILTLSVFGILSSLFSFIGLRKTGLLAVVIGVSFLIPRLSNIERTPGMVAPEPWEQQIIEMLQSYPKSTVVAGFPFLLDNIPIHANRSVYANFEMDTEMRDLWGRERFERILTVLFSETMDEILEFGRETGVDMLLIDKRFYTQEYQNRWKQGRAKAYLEPINRTVLSLVGNRLVFALSNPPPDRILYRYGPYILIQIGN